ncbi:MAG: T9SS type A sorting domain-containing protein [Flavobacteriales bacterium]|nr:T9SS type A sorting domain-containing protein [Flavobacteriales bacterium]
MKQGTLHTTHAIVGGSIANMDSADVQFMQTIAEDETAGMAARKAQNVLCFHYDICYDMEGQPKSEFTPRKPKPSYEQLLAQLNTSTAFPNPADRHVTIGYTLLKAKERTAMHVYDLSGRQIDSRGLGKVYEGQQLFDTRKLPSGVYLFKIVQEGKKISEGKFIVTH